MWTWGASREHLSRYLTESGVVGIGGLVPLMRQATALEPDGLAMLNELEALAYEHPGRFHIFGLCNLDAIERLSVIVSGSSGSVPLIASADSSKWLDAGRYGQAIFIHQTTGALPATHASRLEFAAEWDRARHCSEAARSIAAFCAQQHAIVRTWDDARELLPIYQARYTARAQARQRSRRRRAAASATRLLDYRTDSTAMSYNVPIKVLDSFLRLRPQAAADLPPAVSAALLALEASRARWMMQHRRRRPQRRSKRTHGW